MLETSPATAGGHSGACRAGSNFQQLMNQYGTDPNRLYWIKYDYCSQLPAGSKPKSGASGGRARGRPKIKHPNSSYYIQGTVAVGYHTGFFLEVLERRHIAAHFCDFKRSAHTHLPKLRGRGSCPGIRTFGPEGCPLRGLFLLSGALRWALSDFRASRSYEHGWSDRGWVDGLQWAKA